MIRGFIFTLVKTIDHPMECNYFESFEVIKWMID